MNFEPPITLSRDCVATQIPGGEKIQLTAGTSVRITQALGGSFTVITGWGAMVRIEDKDAEALGKKPSGNATSVAEDSEPVTATGLEEKVWEQLRTCYDPEIPVNMVELGLVYLCKALPLDSGKFKVEVQFTLTAPGCGMGDILRSDIEQKVKALRGVDSVEVNVTFEPPWDKEMMSEAARLQLGI